MTTRLLVIAVAAIGLACSAAHQIGVDGSIDGGTPGPAVSTAGSGTAGGGGGQGGSAVGSTSVTMGTSGPGGTTVGSGGATGGAAGSGSGLGGSAVSDAGDASPNSDAGTDGKVVPPDGSSNAPQRIVFFYTALGTVLDSWRPLPGANGAFSLPAILKPLEPHRNRLLIVDGIDNLVRPGVLNNTDQNGPALLLTGQSSADPRRPGGPSLGNLLSQKWGGGAAFASVQLGVQSNVAIDFQGAGIAEPTNNNPAQAAGVLLNSVPQNGMQFSNTTDFAAAGRQMMDIVRLAIQYDRTRVISLSWGDVNGTTMFSWIAGVDKNYRALATNSGAAGPDRDHFIAAQTWYAEQFAYLVNALATTAEGNGSLLDRTLLVWVSETGEASVRTGKSIPVVMAGNLFGRFRNGAYVQATGSQLNLLSTIAQVAGVGPFGDAALGNTPIAALLKP